MIEGSNEMTPARLLYWAGRINQDQERVIELIKLMNERMAFIGESGRFALIMQTNGPEIKKEKQNVKND